MDSAFVLGVVSYLEINLEPPPHLQLTPPVHSESPIVPSINLTKRKLLSICSAHPATHSTPPRCSWSVIGKTIASYILGDPLLLV